MGGDWRCRFRVRTPSSRIDWLLDWWVPVQINLDRLVQMSSPKRISVMTLQKLCQGNVGIRCLATVSASLARFHFYLKPRINFIIISAENGLFNLYAIGWRAIVGFFSTMLQQNRYSLFCHPGTLNWHHVQL